MIIDEFKNKIFPKACTGFEDDVDEYGLLKKRLEKDSKLPTIGEKPEDEILHFSLEQITILDKFYGSNLISKYFMEKYLVEII